VKATIRLTDAGAATVRLEGSEFAGGVLKVSLFSRKRREYLSPGGWSTKRRTLAEVTPTENVAEFVLEPALAALIPDREPVTFEEIFADHRLDAMWPAQPTPAPHAQDDIDLTDAPNTLDALPPTQDRADSCARPLATLWRWAPFVTLLVGLGAGSFATYLRNPGEPPLAADVANARPSGTTVPPADPGAAAVVDALRAQVTDLTAKLEASNRKLSEAASSPPEKPPAPSTALPSPTGQTVPLDPLSDMLAKQNDALHTSNADLRKQLAASADRSQQDSKSIANLTSDLAAAKKSNFEMSQQLALIKLNAPPARTERSVWGAAAISPGGSIYALQNQTTEDSAVNNAMAICEGRSKGRCQKLTSYSNSCLTLTRARGGVSSDNYLFRKAPDWDSSLQQATEACQNIFGDVCKVAYTVCSPASLEKSDN
jgi:hypothetical protein